MPNLIEILKSITTFGLFTISLTFLTIADLVGKKWSIDQRTIYLIIASLSSMFSGLFYYPILLRQGLVTSSVLWTIFSIFIFIIVGFFVYHETVDVVQVIGIMLGIFSIILLSI